MIPYILKTETISLFPAGAAPITIHKDHMNFHAVRTAIIEGRFDDAVAMASVSSFVNHITAGAVQVGEDGVTFNGVPVTSYLANKMTQFFSEGLDISHYCKFLENLMNNPSMVSREELYLFLEAADLPITDDGCFIAYKAVRADFRDIHSGKFDNSPGQVLSMPRRDVDDNRERTCSYGFHAAAYQYAHNFMFNGRLVAVKINPADVVSVPSDYNNQKLRTCKYEVLHEVEGAVDMYTGQAFINTAPDAGAGDDDDDVEEYSDYDRGYDDAFYSNGLRTEQSSDYYEGYADGEVARDNN